LSHDISSKVFEDRFRNIRDYLEQHDLKALLVFLCEPGICIPGFGGFRHSDTVIVTDQGPDLVTKFPRGLDSLMIRV
jgi:hypothetical protein